MWDVLVLNPAINVLLWLYGWLGQNYVLAIFVFTMLLRLILLPFALKQRQQMKAMQAVQPELDALKKKYPNDAATFQQKTLELYRKRGINPLSSLLLGIVQFPVLIAPYNAIMQVLTTTPEGVIALGSRLYQPLPLWLPDPASLIPIDLHLLWLNLALPDPYFVLPVLVTLTMLLSMWAASRRSAAPAAQNGTARVMQFAMPIMMGVFSLNLAAGVAIYWIVTNLVGTIQAAIS
jgi:YidC/Oxa1 family membrane protein insertase